MDQMQVYRFCPLCKGALLHKENNLLICQACDYHFFINPKPCNGVIVENEKGEILLVKRKFPPRKGYWDLPGGFIAPFEDFEASIKREVKEELGVEITIGKIIGVYKDDYVYKDIRYPTLGIIACASLSTLRITPADDISGFAFFAKDKVHSQKIAFPSIKRAIKDYLTQY